MMKMTKIILGAFLALFLVGCSSGPGATAENFFDALKDGDVSGMQEYSTQSTQQILMMSLSMQCGGAVESEDGLSQCLKESFGEFTKFEATEEKISESNPNSATVSLKEYKTDGSSVMEQIKLVKVDGDWKVNMSK